MRVFQAIGWIVLTAGMTALNAQTQTAMKPNAPHTNIVCQACHISQQKIPTQQTCFRCHGDYPTISARTSSKMPNPHKSHMGRVECTECHAMHKKPRFMCTDCHAFEDVRIK